MRVVYAECMNDVDSYVVVKSMKYIGLDLNTTFKFRLPETFSRYQPRPQPVEVPRKRFQLAKFKSSVEV